MAQDKTKIEAAKPLALTENIQRRQFLKFAGATVALGTVIGCKKESIPASTPYINTDNTIDFKEDKGLLNYIYALEQLEAAFYIKVFDNAPADLTVSQKAFLNDIKLHEIAHRALYKNFLGAAGIDNLEFDFSSIDFSSAATVFAAAKTLEDLGLAAYNGALIRAKENYTFVLLSQVSSVEARHAAWIREQISPNSFAGLNELSPLGGNAANGFDVLLSPNDVLTQANKYIKTKLNVINI